ncbi:MAG: hypothetical protein Q9183_003827 [Haloplaca sp. 2 TL-2023]
MGSLDFDVAADGDSGLAHSPSYERSRTKQMPTLTSTQANTHKAKTENRQAHKFRIGLPVAPPTENKVVPDGKAKPNRPLEETLEDESNKDLLTARLNLEQLRKKQGEAEKSKDLATAADLLYYAIPEQEQQIEILQRAQNETQARKKAQQPEVHSGSDENDDDNESEDLDLYD